MKRYVFFPFYNLGDITCWFTEPGDTASRIDLNEHPADIAEWFQEHGAAISWVSEEAQRMIYFAGKEAFSVQVDERLELLFKLRWT